MLMRLFNSIDLIGCGGDISQSDSCKVWRKAHMARKVRKAHKAHKVRKVRKACIAHKAHKAHMVCKAHKVVAKISGFYVNEVVQFH